MRIKSPEAAELMEFKGDLLTVSATRPLPPGSRVAFVLPIGGETPVSVQGKVLHADPMSEDSNRFLMTLRVHSLTRDERDRLLSASGTASQ